MSVGRSVVLKTLAYTPKWNYHLLVLIEGLFMKEVIFVFEEKSVKFIIIDFLMI